MRVAILPSGALLAETAPGDDDVRDRAGRRAGARDAGPAWAAVGCGWVASGSGGGVTRRAPVAPSPLRKVYSAMTLPHDGT